MAIVHQHLSHIALESPPKPNLLAGWIEDARIAVRELDQMGIYTYCINLDTKADEYVADIFGYHYTVIDNIAKLPERLPRLFMYLTK